MCIDLSACVNIYSKKDFYCFFKTFQKSNFMATKSMLLKHLAWNWNPPLGLDQTTKRYASDCVILSAFFAEAELRIAAFVCWFSFLERILLYLMTNFHFCFPSPLPFSYIHHTSYSTLIISEACQEGRVSCVRRDIQTAADEIWPHACFEFI